MAPRSAYRILSMAISVLPVFVRHRFWRCLLRVGERYYEYEGAAQRIPGGMYIKAGVLIRPVEAQATQFISTQTSLPVPVVIDSFSIKNATWIVMSRLPGYNLANSYMEITPEVEERLSGQLARILAPLRAIPAPSSAVCGFDQGPIYCGRMAFGAPPLGPFENVDFFHDFLLTRAGTLRIPEKEDAALIHETINRVHARPHRLCLTHNDLGPHNVLVDDDWNITGIVDWESCAWMPAYWELTKGTFLPPFRQGRWDRIMRSAFPEFAEELKVERYIVSYRLCYG